MKSRKIKYSSALKTLIVILLIICVWVNLFSFYHLEASIRPDDYFIPKYLFPKKQSYVSKTKAWVPPKFDLDHPPPFSSLQVIHTVQTRFMVGQPNQPILARARFMLFETFCFPTMRYQTSQNFYWIVLVDPRLQEDILNDMQTLLKNMPNAFLVLTSNTTWAADGVGVPNVVRRFIS